MAGYDKEAVEDALKALFDAAKSGDWTEACQAFADAQRLVDDDSGMEESEGDEPKGKGLIAVIGGPKK